MNQMIKQILPFFQWLEHIKFLPLQFSLVVFFLFDSDWYVVVWCTSDFSSFSISLFEGHTAEIRYVTDGWALVCAVNELSTEKLSACSRSSNSKCRQTSGSHMHLLAYCKSWGPMEYSTWKFSGWIFTNRYGSCFIVLLCFMFYCGVVGNTADWH